MVGFGVRGTLCHCPGPFLGQLLSSQPLHSVSRSLRGEGRGVESVRC